MTSKVRHRLIIAFITAVPLGAFAYLYNFVNSDERFAVVAALIGLIAASQSAKELFIVQGSSKERTSNFLWNLGLWVVLAALIVSFYTIALEVIATMFSYALEYGKTLDFGLLVAISVAVVGCIMFKIREWFRWCYGLAELAVGVQIAFYKAPLVQGFDFFLVVITGGVYLVVRGLDNMSQGSSTDKLVSFLRKLIAG